jgi:hypothetical protein
MNISHPQCLNEVLSESANYERLSGSKLKSWTQYDAAKFMLGVWIMERICSFFRIRSNIWVRFAVSGIRGAPSGVYAGNMYSHSDNAVNITSDVVGIVAVDTKSISYAFQTLGLFYLKISNGNTTTTNRTWLTSPHPLAQSYGNTNDSHDLSKDIDVTIQGDVLRSVESLVCTLHDISLLLSQSELANWRQDLNYCEEVAELYPSHSFVKQTAKSIVGARKS